MPCRGPRRGLAVVRSAHLEKISPQNEKLQGVVLGVCKTSILEGYVEKLYIHMTGSILSIIPGLTSAILPRYFYRCLLYTSDAADD